MNGINAIDDSETSWWRRPAGGREVLQIALPMVISSLSWTIMTFVDRMMLKWNSGIAMSAAFTAGMVWFAVLCLPLGVCSYVNTFVSQYYGDGQNDKIGPSTWQGIWFAVLCGPLMLAAIPFAPAIFGAAGHTTEMADLEVRYFQILCWGAPPLLIAQAASAFYAGRGRTVVMMWVDSAYAGLNLVLDYLWIFGYGGFPAWGIDGAAWATVVSLWLKAITYILLILQRDHRHRFATWSGMRLDRVLFNRLIYFGGPSGAQMLLDITGFTVFTLLVARLGAVEAEATSMAFSISMLAFMPVYGLGLATGVLVGQHLGQDRDDLAARATWTTLAISLGYMVVISAAYVLMPDVFLFGFFQDEAPTAAENEAVRLLGQRLLIYVAAYNLFDAAAIVFVNAIKGAGDTVFVLGVSVVMATLLTTASWIGIEKYNVDIHGCWGILTVWIWLFGMTFFLRFVQGKWRRMRVIEQM